MANPRHRNQIGEAARPSRIAKRTADSAPRVAARPRASAERSYRRLERQCDALREEAEWAQRDQSELYSTLSHDLKNTINVLLVSTQMLARSLPAEAPARRYIDALARAGDELNQMAQDVSDAARISEGELEVTVRPVGVAALLDEAALAVRPVAQSKSITVTAEVAPGLVEVTCDRARLVRVLSVLAGNAIRFTPKAGAVALRAERDDEGARFSVTDTGPGIPPEHRPALFARPFAPREPEHGAPPRRARYRATQGSGLALFVVRGVIEVHGGRVWVESEPGQGSTFHFTLPDGDSLPG
jgi:signal transduction histidine kinase